MMKLASWNVNYRIGKQAQQFDALMALKPDLIALQEITPRSLPLWQDKLSENGYYVANTFELAAESSLLIRARKSGLIVASRWPMTALDPSDFDIPWNERVLSMHIDAPVGTLELHNIHMPAGVSHGIIKVETFEGVYKRLAANSSLPRIVCGDFNSPKAETIDGQTIPFGKKRDLRWQSAELSIIRGLAEFDLSDVYRICNGYQDTTIKSWRKLNRGKINGGRLDHTFASSALNPVRCEYHTYVIDSRLSDHAIMVTEFAPE